ncbi:MAG: sigma-54-dependent Fis family transcriptional regulator [Desulfobacula sp.]|jgi:DNA-binding NtrC family response regulator|uniref:sigma-54-dependent transcriptional regulator n=1 Tax=Desulfobacula sp. TaxID=2593537 RepID=UPI001D6DFBD2|nr:sigma-54-dependent Fis family transcriptional regulator [Desulfobacula sp.]MBT3485689.1 sigma-54-dependent Fis family transcriptional regulator [Desulfobacula sp.]MBT3807638.1 sigma-54-dependent Fis family transcriptional regulator [Desulfobacula sp.]MBT4025840.1 sigma-54-dependent Fis family transcriptional regulator [Desulfobacula sp.]MBT4199254.1 sigma-54-dependent Fis family transcriptional regulator [Desulfobacula sp.]
MAKILIIDDEPSILESLSMFLTEKGHRVFTAETGAIGLELFSNQSFQVVIMDIRLPDFNGLDILQTMIEKKKSSKIIMITAFQDMETTILAIKRGAFDYIHKPLDVMKIEKAVNRAINILEIDRETPALEPANETSDDPFVIIGKSEKMRKIFKMMGLVCNSRVNILLQGETGTGKELIAKVIHLNSSFKDEPFVVFDCSAVVGTLLESELFGHEKGSFTGADSTTRGKIEQAGNGTLFLDEIAQLPLAIQGKLLGFLQRREYTRVGGSKTLKSRARIIAACNCNLADNVNKGIFKDDLYYRLKVFMIEVPALNDRLSDTPFLVEHFLKKINRELGTRATKLQDGAMEMLVNHTWKGNVRELENTIAQALVGCRGNVLLKDDIHKLLNAKNRSQKMGLESYSLAHVEKDHITKTLFQLQWNKTKSAKLLGISLPTLRSKIKKYKIHKSDTQ